MEMLGTVKHFSNLYVTAVFTELGSNLVYFIMIAVITNYYLKVDISKGIFKSRSDFFVFITSSYQEAGSKYN